MNFSFHPEILLRNLTRYFLTRLLSLCTKMFVVTHTKCQTELDMEDLSDEFLCFFLYFHAFTFIKCSSSYEHCVCVYSVQNTEMWAHRIIRIRTMNENWKATKTDVKVWNVDYFACFKCAYVWVHRNMFDLCTQYLKLWNWCCPL